LPDVRRGEPKASAPSNIIALLGDWSTPERAAIGGAVLRLPVAVRVRLPRAFARDAEQCDPDRWPEDTALVDRNGGLHVCAAAGAKPEEVALRVAGALLFAFDKSVGWSDDPEWRRLNRWSSSIFGAARAENLAPRAFAAVRGHRSPRWDLVTFLEAAWLAPRSSADDVSCRLLSQAGFVRARLAALGGAPVAASRCVDFERWAELDRLADVEIVLAAPSTAMVGSLFGHLFLRLVYRDEDGATPPHLSRTVAFLADNDVPFEADRGYAWKGIAGLYTASLHERSYLDAFREYVVTEGRDLRRWRLTLTAGERAALMARIWTVGGAGQYAYYFFRQNCATLMMDLVEDAVAPLRTVGHGQLVASPPASTLEMWATARGATGEPVLGFIPEPVLSFDHEARLTSRQRVELEPRILEESPGAPRAALAVAFRDAHAPAADTRAKAYAQLAFILSDVSVGSPRDIYEWLRDSAAIESHLSIVSNLQAEARADADRRHRAGVACDELARTLRAAALATDDARLGDAVARLGDDDRERRMEGYRALLTMLEEPASQPDRSERLRLYALLESEMRYDVARLKREPQLRDALLFSEPNLPLEQQAYLRGRADLVSVPVVTTISPALRALEATRERVFAARELASVRSAPDEGLSVGAARAEYEASLHRSGIDQVAVYGGILASGADWPALVPALGLGGALYDERLGDHRRFGFPSDTAFVVARNEMWLGQGAASFVPRVLAYEVRALGYRSLRLPLPEADASRLPLGWEAFVDLRGNRARSLASEVRAGWGAVRRLVDRGELADHVLAAFDIAYVGAFPTPGAPAGYKPQALAAPLALETRVRVGATRSHRSWLAARGSIEPGFVLAGAPRRFVLETAGQAEAHIALRSRAAESAHDPAFVLSARLLRTTLSVDRAHADVEGLLSIGVELR
jgi:hypothetical protein